MMRKVVGQRHKIAFVHDAMPPAHGTASPESASPKILLHPREQDQKVPAAAAAVPHTLAPSAQTFTTHSLSLLCTPPLLLLLLALLLFLSYSFTTSSHRTYSLRPSSLERSMSLSCVYEGDHDAFERDSDFEDTINPKHLRSPHIRITFFRSPHQPTPHTPPSPGTPPRP